MLNRLSVSVLLKSVIAVLGATVIIMLALGARDSWTRLNTANRISGIANVSTYMFTALNSLATALAAVDFSDRDQAIADLSNRTKRLADLQEKTAAAMAQPKSERPAELVDAYGK